MGTMFPLLHPNTLATLMSELQYREDLPCIRRDEPLILLVRLLSSNLVTLKAEKRILLPLVGICCYVQFVEVVSLDSVK